MNRDDMIKLCIKATAEIYDMEESQIDKSDFNVLNDEDLYMEFIWLKDNLMMGDYL